MVNQTTGQLDNWTLEYWVYVQSLVSCVKNLLLFSASMTLFLFPPGYCLHKDWMNIYPNRCVKTLLSSLFSQNISNNQYNIVVNTQHIKYNIYHFTALFLYSYYFVYVAVIRINVQMYSNGFICFISNGGYMLLLILYIHIFIIAHYVCMRVYYIYM